MDTAWLEVFRHIAHTGSFTAAASQLGYTQSAVSRQISALEKEVGAALFDRMPRGVRLTESGRFLLRHAEAILDRIHDAKADLDGLRSLRTGRVRIGSFATAGVRLVPQAIASFRRANPDIALSHQDGLTRELVAKVAADDLDVAVINGFADQIDALPDVALTHLLDEDLLVAVPADHHLASREHVALPELADDDWVAGNPAPQETLIRTALRQGFTPRITHVVQEWIAKQGFVAAGLGVTLIPALAVDSVRGDIRLLRLSTADTPIRGIYAAAPATHSVAAAGQEFISTLRSIGTQISASTWVDARQMSM